MFKFAMNGQVRWPAQLPQRTPEGLIQLQPVVFTFQMLTREELVALDRETTKSLTRKFTDLLAPAASGASSQKDAPKDAAGVDALISDFEKNEREAYERVLEKTVGWDENAIKAVDADNNEVPFGFSPSNLRILLSDQGIFRAVRAALLEASRGAKEKN